MDFLEICERSYTGEKVSKEDWDLDYVALAIRDLLDEYDLSYQPGEGVVGAKMPLKYVLEMACDRIAACKIYHGSSYTDRDPWEYYSAKNSCVHVCLHKDTRAMLEKILQMLAEEGEEKTIRYMRWLIRNPQIYEDGSISSGRA